jgi:hypothetical protein
MSARFLQLLDCCRGQVGSHSVLDVWRIVLLCLMWSIWRERERERNARCLEDHEKTKEELKNILIKLLFSWTKHLSIF